MHTGLKSLPSFNDADSSVARTFYGASSTQSMGNFSFGDLLLQTQKDVQNTAVYVCLNGAGANFAITYETAISTNRICKNDVLNHIVVKHIEEYFNFLRPTSVIEVDLEEESLDHFKMAFLCHLENAQQPFHASAELDTLADAVLQSLNTAEDEDVETWAKSLAKDFAQFVD